jgi:hypothetical protein
LAIKNYFPGSSLTLASSEKNHFYAKELNFFDNIYMYPKKNILQKIKFFFFILKKNFDYIFVFDGKDRSLISILLNSCKNKFAIYSKDKIKLLYKIFNISFIKNDGQKSINGLFQEMLDSSKINTQVSNYYNFLEGRKYKDIYELPINNYLHIHFDEKWFNNTYIKTLTEINPTEEDFASFLNELALRKNDILITTGILKVDLLEKMKKSFFTKKTSNIYYKEISNYKIFFIENSTFHNLEFLVKNSKTLIACHGSLQQVASAFEIKILDIFEKNQEIWYRRHTKHIKNYNFFYRKPFSLLKGELLSFFS